MANEVWSDDELEAALRVYLEMLALEQTGQRYNKSAYRRALIEGPLQGRKTAEQRMQNFSYVLQELNRPWIVGYKPYGHIGDPAKARIVQLLEKIEGTTRVPKVRLNEPLRPRRLPVSVSGTRKHPPTGYWMFMCNRNKWDGEAWLREGERSLLYLVDKDHHHEVQAGDLGIIRMNRQPGTTRRPARPAGAYALVEVVSQAAIQADPDARHYVKAGDGDEPDWRVGLHIIANLVERPVDAASLPEGPDFTLIKQGQQARCFPLTEVAFDEIVRRSRARVSVVNLERRSASASGVQSLERTYYKSDPERRERVSIVIERGPVGDRVKSARNHRCQICETLGASDPVAFIKKNGRPYAEAHHVMPVSEMKLGSLEHGNIMVLCPNHHRQAHYGSFEVVEFREKSWLIRIDGKGVELPRTSLN